MRLLHFLSYHNAVPIALGIIFLGGASVFAATNPDAILSAEETIISVDNTYIANKDLSSFTPTVRISEVTEDDDFYYISYQFTTIDLVDYVWKDIVKEELLKVSKDALGPYRDLGLYATEQLRQKVEREIAYLKEVQSIEKRQISNKTVATAYGGLVGALLNDKTETIPGYTPVVTPPPPPKSSAQVASASGSSNVPAGASGSGPGAPIIQILGNNPAWIPLKSTYSDLGAIVTDDKDINIGIHVFFGGKEVTIVSLDTSTTTEYKITYRATDTDGNIGEAVRTVVVYNPATDTPPEITPNIPIVTEPSTQNAEEDTAVENQTPDETEQVEPAASETETEEDTITEEVISNDEEESVDATTTPSEETNTENTTENTTEDITEDAVEDTTEDAEDSSDDSTEVDNGEAEESQGDGADDTTATTTPSE